LQGKLGTDLAYRIFGTGLAYIIIGEMLFFSIEIAYIDERPFI
jgi:hypothetical protein